MPERMKNTRIFRFKRYIKGVGWIRRSAKTQKVSEFRYRDGILVKLMKVGALETLRLFKHKHLDIDDLIDADRHGRLEHVADSFRLHRPLKVEVDRWLPKSADAAESRRRYDVSWSRFFRVAEKLGQISEATALVSDLARIDYDRVWRSWSASSADWNRARAAVSSFLTNYLGHLHHPFRLQVMGRYPTKKEPKGRIPTVTLADFWTTVAKAPEHARPSYVVMFLTGTGPKEYLGIRKRDLFPDINVVRVNGTKTPDRQRDVVVDPRYWAWVERGVPSNLQYRWLNIYWKRACEAAELEDFRMYDIRHLTGQIAGDFGISDRDMTVHLGHSNVQMTHRYTRRAVSKRTASAIADALAQIEGQRA